MSDPAVIANELWVHGIVECLNLECLHRCVAVWPLGADNLECPHCHGTDTVREAASHTDLADRGADE